MSKIMVFSNFVFIFQLSCFCDFSHGLGFQTNSLKYFLKLIT